MPPVCDYAPSTSLDTGGSLSSWFQTWAWNVKASKNWERSAAVQPSSSYDKKCEVLLQVPSCSDFTKLNFCSHLNNVFKCIQRCVQILFPGLFSFQISCCRLPRSAEFPGTHKYQLIHSHLPWRSLTYTGGIIFRYGTQSQCCMEQNQPRMKLVDQMIVFVFYFYVLSRHFYTRVKRSKRLNGGDNGENPGAMLFPGSSTQCKPIHRQVPISLVTLLLFKSPRVEVICVKGEISNSVHTH